MISSGLNGADAQITLLVELSAGRKFQRTRQVISWWRLFSWRSREGQGATLPELSSLKDRSVTLSSHCLDCVQACYTFLTAGTWPWDPQIFTTRRAGQESSSWKARHRTAHQRHLEGEICTWCWGRQGYPLWEEPEAWPMPASGKGYLLHAGFLFQRTDGKREKLGDFVHEYLQRRFGLQQMVVEWGYNLHDACQRYAHDEIIGLFWDILTEKVSDQCEYISSPVIVYCSLANLEASVYNCQSPEIHSLSCCPIVFSLRLMKNCIMDSCRSLPSCWTTWPKWTSIRAAWVNWPKMISVQV